LVKNSTNITFRVISTTSHFCSTGHIFSYFRSVKVMSLKVKHLRIVAIWCFSADMPRHWCHSKEHSGVGKTLPTLIPADDSNGRKLTPNATCSCHSTNRIKALKGVLNTKSTREIFYFLITTNIRELFHLFLWYQIPGLKSDGVPPYSRGEI